MIHVAMSAAIDRTIGTKNKMRTRVERREKGSDPVPPYVGATSACSCVLDPAAAPVPHTAPHPQGTAQCT
jgi:hypothetical protein